jgi:hypothetical protein
MGPRMMAEPCPANPNDTMPTPSYSVGVMAPAPRVPSSHTRTALFISLHKKNK